MRRKAVLIANVIFASFLFYLVSFFVNRAEHRLFVFFITAGADVVLFCLVRFFFFDFLRSDFNGYDLGAFRLFIPWILTAVLIPASVSGFYMILNGKFNKDGFSMLLLIYVTVQCIFRVLFIEVLFTGVILKSLKDIAGNTLAVVICSFVFAAANSLSFGYSPTLTVFVFMQGLFFRGLISLIEIHSENMWNPFLVSFVTEYFFSIVNFGQFDEKFPVNYIVGTSRLFFIVVTCIAYFVALSVAVFCLIKKRKAQFLYW